jgi:hypothetical protein
MAELVRLARTPYPLPLGALRSRRSLLSLDNLVAAIETVLSRPGQLRRPLIVSDPEALTIPDIVAAVRRGLGRRPGLIPVPAAVLRTALYAAGRSEIYERLSGSLVAGPCRTPRTRLVAAPKNAGGARCPRPDLTNFTPLQPGRAADHERQALSGESLQFRGWTLWPAATSWDGEIEVVHHFEFTQRESLTEDRQRLGRSQTGQPRRGVFIISSGFHGFGTNCTL